MWVHWGPPPYLKLLQRSVASVAMHVDADRYVISDAPIPASIPAKNIIHQFTASGFMRKPEVLSQIVPEGHGVVLFLDSDTVVLGDIDFGFSQADKHGVAISLASNYSLADYYDSGIVMRREGLASVGQSLYNSGVIFYRPTGEVLSLLSGWNSVSVRNVEFLKGDQEALTIAMLTAEFNPYVLSKSFNVRGPLEVLSGEAYIWHAKGPVPRGINSSHGIGTRRVLVNGRIRAMSSSFLAGGPAALFFRWALRTPYLLYSRLARRLGVSPK